MQTLSRAAITQFINDWVKDAMAYHNHSTIEQLVEEGYCADLATLIWEHFGRPEDNILPFHNCDAPCHVWIEFEGFHFDMQNPDGVANWKDMQYFQNHADAVIDPDDVIDEFDD